LLLAQIQSYVGQKLPDNYYNKIMQAINYAEKMVGRFTHSNPFNNGAGNAVNTPALFIAWLQKIYCAIKLGSAQAFIKVLMSDKFLSIDISEIYEKQIRSH
ncbi:10954_t:CDS:2, partial [Funneliformis geosporum]